MPIAAPIHQDSVERSFACRTAVPRGTEGLPGVGFCQRGAENSETVRAFKAKVRGLIQYAQISHGPMLPAQEMHGHVT